MSHNNCWVLILVLLASSGVLKSSTEPIYDEKADARRDISAAIADARTAKKNIVLVFGANWCPDCHALDAQMHNPELAALLAQNFVIVKVDMGRHDKNMDLAEQYKVPIKHGIPALAVLDSDGHLLYAMDQGQFADARHMSYESIKAFFEQWRPKN
jgi:protein disulfide-isomerase